MEVVYIRHAEAESNILTPDSIVGSDLELTPNGTRQAEVTAGYLATLAIKGAIGPIDSVIYSSPYIRARQTATIIANELKTSVAIDYRLKEIQKGDWHGMNVNDVIELEEQVLPRDVHEFRPPNGENWFDVADRMVQFVAEAEERGDHSLIVVSHNHPIEIAIGKLTGLDMTEWKDNPVDNASISRIIKRDGLWMIDESLYNYKPWLNTP